MHLTDDQLNEYLDNESAERAQIEMHLSTCDECAARLTALQTLFAEIESLPQLELTHSFAARFIPTSSLPPQLPTWLTLTATLQAVIGLIALILAAPFVSNRLPAIEMPSYTTIFAQIQTQWNGWFALFATLRLNAGQAFQLPALPHIPALEVSSLVLTLTLASVSVLWLLGNGLLLRKQR
jgi:anti-sigma factor RsiW